MRDWWANQSRVWKVRSFSAPQCCEICHQGDCYNAEQNYCTRCAGIVATNFPAAQPLPEIGLLQQYVQLFKHTARVAGDYLLRRRFELTIESIIVIVMVGFIGVIALPACTLGSRSHNRSANGASAIESLLEFHSAELKYKSGIGTGNFGSISDLYYNDLIDPLSADAAGAPAMTSKDGYKIEGKSNPKSGYIFYLIRIDASNDHSARFTALAIAAHQTGTERSGDRNFYIDETGVVRASTTATVIPDVNSTPLNN
jgi:hypothetical protein